jgi:uncharacterized delta-60 repeat protein
MNAKVLNHIHIGQRFAMRVVLLTALVLLALGALFVSAQALTLVSETTWGGASSDVTRGAAVGADGSTYLLGNTRSFSGSPDRSVIFLVKFAADGSFAWDRTWTGPQAFVSDEARDVAVASDGSVYVTGSTLGTAGDVVLLKFDPDGSLDWQRSWGGSGTESGQGVAVAPDDSVYVVGGTSSFGAGSGAIFILRFAPDGTLVRQQIWDTGASEGGDDVAVAQDGSIYVAGGTPRSGAVVGSDVVVLKIDPDGNLVWQRTYAAGEIVDARGGVTVGPDGSVYVAGAVQEVTNSGNVIFDAILLKFTPDGSLEWDRGWGGRDGDDAGGVAVAPDGTVFLAGTTASFGAGGGGDAFLVQLMPSGRATEAMTWGSAELDTGSAVRVAPDGSIILGATTRNPPPYSFLRAGTRTSRLRGILGTPAGTLAGAGGNVVDPGGVVDTPNGSLTYAGDFDAALVRITP